MGDVPLQETGARGDPIGSLIQAVTTFAAARPTKRYDTNRARGRPSTPPYTDG